MQVIFDNLAATIVVSIITLLLFGYVIRAQDEMAQATNDNLLRKQQMAFIETLQQDLSNMTDVEPPLTSSDLFVFYTRVGSDTTTKKVVYDKEFVRTRDSVDLYRIQRRSKILGATGSPTTNGGSMSLITKWNIKGLNKDGKAPSGPANVEQVKVFFETAMPLDYEDDLTRRRYWEATFRPIEMQTGGGL